MIDYCKSCTQKPQPLTREGFEELIKQPWLAQLAHEIAQGNLARKRELPAACWQATYGGQKRSNQNAIPSGLFALDVDHIEDPEALYHSFRERIGELGIYIVHKTPSTHGLRIVAGCRPQLQTIGDNQQWLSAEIGVEHDAVTRDLARLSFLVPESYFYYYNPEVFSLEPRALSLEPKAEFRVESLEFKENHSDGNPAHSSQPTAQSIDYDGIAYSLLVESLAEQLGGIPTHGARNNFIFSMACHLRYLCNDDPSWILAVLPTYGEDPAKVERTVHSACSRPQSRQLPALVQRAIATARAKAMLTLEPSAQGTTDVVFGSEPPAMPRRLPQLIQLLVSKVDPMYRPAVAMSVFPALGAHLHGVQTRYIDNSINDLGGFMSILMAKQSIGKGAINMPIEAIMEDIRNRDNYSRQQEQQWKQQCKQAKSNEKKPARPEGLCVQYLMSNMTNAAMVQRLIDAQKSGGKFIYVKLDEIELLDQIRATGGATASEIIRLAFTQSLYGQERVGNESITGTPPLRFCFNASTTVPTGQHYFRKGLTNGTLSRLTFATIVRPQSRRGIPRFGDYDEEFHQQLAPYIENLNNATGQVRCPKAEAMASRLCQESEELAELSDDDIFETLSYRSNRIAYDKAMLLYIAHGYQWNKDIEEFCRWSQQYDLWCKLHFFGQSMRTQQEQETLAPTHGPRNMLDLLPDRFNPGHLTPVYMVQKGNHIPGTEVNKHIMQFIYTWTSRGHIEQDTTTGEYLKTPKYLSKHPSNV